MNPVADVRDIIADGKRVLDGENGSYIKFGASIIGGIPLGGDILKPILKKVGKEVFTKTEKELVKEVAEKLVKEGVEKETAEKVAKQEVPKLIKIEKELIDNRQQFKQIFSQKRYSDYAQKVEITKTKKMELKDIATEDLVAIKGYTSDDYGMLNNALRTGDKA